MTVFSFRTFLFAVLLQRESYSIPVEFFQNAQEGFQAFSLIFFVSAYNTRETLFTVKRDPGKLSAVIIQKTGSQSDSSARGYIGKRRVMIGTVEIIDLSRADKAMLDCAKRQGRASSDHQSPTIEILFADQVFTGKRI